MTIQLLFEFVTDHILVTIQGKNVKFANSQYGAQECTIDGMQLDYNGVINENPDLEGSSEWREVAIKRFKQKIENMGNEEEIAKYLVEDLKKFGYKPKQKQKDGFRPTKI